MKNIIVGVVGHIDHGKTALVESMSGFCGDTLEEEIKRGITINLSFSNIKNSTTNISLIDVPGHEKLLKNMISGVFSFDASIVVIDINEGVMPQTNEHLEILNLLHTKYIIVALTKTDLVKKEIITQRLQEIKKYFKKFSYLELKDIVPVSIYKKESIEQLKEKLFSIPLVKKNDNGLFRCYIDRSFSLRGIGTIVTGTVLGGKVQVGDKVFAPELQVEVVVKNIQVHEKQTKEVLSSQRVALNIQNTKTNLKKGTLLSKKGFIRGFFEVDVWIKGILHSKLKHNTEITIFIGTKQLQAKILLYDEAKTTEGFARLRFSKKVFLIYNEPFIVCSNGRTIGGGRVINPINDPIKKIKKIELLKGLKNGEFKKVFKILTSVHKKGFGLISSTQRFGLTHKEALSIASQLDDIFIDSQELTLYPLSVKSDLRNIVSDIYKKNEYALLSAKSLTIKIKWTTKSLLQEVLDEIVPSGKIEFKNGIYKNTDMDIDDIDKIIEDKIYLILQNSGFKPDAPYNIYDNLDIDRKMGDDALKRLTKSRKVVRLAHNVFIASDNLADIMSKLREVIKKDGFVDINSFKKHYNMSRKYLVAYLDNLDRFNDIKKDGTRRVML